MGFAGKLVQFAAAAALLMPAAAFAEYPERAIQIVVPFAAGGATDLMARTIANVVSENVGKPVVIENRSGGGTVIGTEAVVRAAPDGYTILFGSGALAIDPSFKKLSYDVRKDLIPITKAAWGPFAVLVHSSVPANSLKEFVAYAKSKPGELNMGSSGIGSMGHLASEYLRSILDLKLEHIPYRGAGPALQAILAGDLQIYLDPPFTAKSSIVSGKVRPLAVTGARRSPLLPDVPTVAELGYPGFAAGHWGGYFVPAKTPDAIVKKLSFEFVKALKDPRVRDVLIGQGLEVIGNSPEEFKKEIEEEIELWAKVIREAGIKPQIE